VGVSMGADKKGGAQCADAHRHRVAQAELSGEGRCLS
jgi:hypothetical protein